MALIAVFAYVLFSVLGLGLIHISRIYGKLGRHKKNMALLEYSAENGIKQGFGFLAERMQERDEPADITDEELALLQQNAEAGGFGFAERALDCVFPQSVEETAGDQIWRSSAAMASVSLSPRGGYFFIENKCVIAAEGELRGVPIRKKASLEASLTILAGRLPLAFFPLLIAGGTTPEERQSYKQNPNIIFLGENNTPGVPHLNFTEAAAIPRNADPLLKKALKIQILTPGGLTRSELRSALGLEMVNEPVPESVYLIHNDTGLGGVYVQGDLDEMILAVDSGWQVISFRREEKIWLLRFNPAQSSTVFAGPDATQTFGRVPLGIIMVNGRVDSLGGGIVNVAGAAEMGTDETIPSVLSGVSLSIVAADQVTLTSHLTQQGVKWLDGIPYLKDSTSQLMICAAGRDFIDGADKAGRILIDPNAPASIKVQASLTATDGVELGGGRKTLVLAGGMQIGGLTLNGNTLKILPDERFLENKLIPENAPTTSAPVLQVLALRPLRWNEY